MNISTSIIVRISEAAYAIAVAPHGFASLNPHVLAKLQAAPVEKLDDKAFRVLRCAPEEARDLREYFARRGAAFTAPAANQDSAAICAAAGHHVKLALEMAGLMI